MTARWPRLERAIGRDDLGIAATSPGARHWAVEREDGVDDGDVVDGGDRADLRGSGGDRDMGPQHEPAGPVLRVLVLAFGPAAATELSLSREAPLSLLLPLGAALRLALLRETRACLPKYCATSADEPPAVAAALPRDSHPQLKGCTKQECVYCKHKIPSHWQGRNNIFVSFLILVWYIRLVRVLPRAVSVVGPRG
jgi:hypothetical protein